MKPHSRRFSLDGAEQEEELRLFLSRLSFKE